MAEKKVENKETTPLLMESLTIPERVMLGQMTSVGGFKVLVKLFDAACSRATADVVKLDPESSDFERVLAERQRRARAINEFCASVMKSIDYHVDLIRREAAAEEVQVEDAVAKTFGIHTIPPKTKKVVGALVIPEKDRS